MIRLNEHYQCIQGEGHHAGKPMWLIRLQGCDVGCPWCDTKESWDEGGTPTDEVELVASLQAENPAIKWAMITGGEPCLQKLDALCAALAAGGFSIVLETSGTEEIKGVFNWVTVSPKVGMGGGKRLVTAALGRADEIKMPVGSQRDVDYLLDVLDLKLWGSRLVVSLQPLSASKSATDLCYAACLKHGWNLSLQLHRWIGAR